MSNACKKFSHGALVINQNKNKERERERGGRRCKKAEEEGGRERERSSARKLGEFGI